MGRPSLFTQELAEEICSKLSEGIPLAEICRQDHMPAVRTVSDWKKANEGFSADFARARDDGFDAIAARCMLIADDEEHDWVMTKKGTITNDVAIARARLQVETRLKLLAKWDPKRYGDRIAQEISGPDGGPIQSAPAMSDEKMDALAEKIAKARERREQ